MNCMSVSWARGGTCAAPPPSGYVVKCFCALVVTGKRSVDKLFMHYFHNLSSASGGLVPKPAPGFHPWTSLGDFRFQTHNLPTPLKILRAPMVSVRLTALTQLPNMGPRPGNLPRLRLVNANAHFEDCVSLFCSPPSDQKYSSVCH